MSEPVPPFKVGDMVRLTPHGHKTRPWLKLRRGIVMWIRPSGGWDVPAWRFGLASFDKPTVCKRWELISSSGAHIPEWELVPAADLTTDETAQALARAVLAGDTEAALGLADHVFEIYGGGR